MLTNRKDVIRSKFNKNKLAWDIDESGKSNSK